MPDLVPVTDPQLLQQLETAPQPTVQPVTDPALLTQLNQSEQPQTFMQKLGQTWPARLAKDVYSAAKLPGDIYAGNTQIDLNNPEFMKRVTTLGGVTPVGTLPSVTSATPSVSNLIQEGGKQIDEAVNSGLMFPQQKIQAGIDAIRKQLPDRRVAEDTHATLDALESKVQSGAPITFSDIKQTRDELLDLQANAAKSTSRTAATDLRAATAAKHGLDDIVAGTPEGDQFIAGNANVSGGKQAESLDKRLYRSELRASAANSGKNIGNTIRQNVASMLLSKDARAMPPEARSMAENIVYGSGPENFMRHYGNLLGGGGGLGQAITMGGSGVLGYLASGGSPTVTGIAATAGPIVGSLLKHGANEAAISHMEALSNVLRANTPLGETATRGNYLNGVMPSTAAAKAALIRALMGQSPYSPIGQ